MRVQVDNRVVTMVLVSREVHQSNGVVYHELNEHGQPTTEHSFARDYFHTDGSFWTNGHHYRTGNKVGVKCELPECDCCVHHNPLLDFDWDAISDAIDGGDDDD